MTEKNASWLQSADQGSCTPDRRSVSCCNWPIDNWESCPRWLNTNWAKNSLGGGGKHDRVKLFCQASAEQILCPAGKHLDILLTYWSSWRTTRHAWIMLLPLQQFSAYQWKCAQVYLQSVSSQLTCLAKVICGKREQKTIFSLTEVWLWRVDISTAKSGDSSLPC